VVVVGAVQGSARSQDGAYDSRMAEEQEKPLSWGEMRRRAQRHLKRAEPAPLKDAATGDHPVLVLIDRLMKRINDLEAEIKQLKRHRH